MLINCINSPETVLNGPTSSQRQSHHVRLRQLVAHPFPERFSDRRTLRRDQPRRTFVQGTRTRQTRDGARDHLQTSSTLGAPK